MLRFASSDEALQHLSDLTGKKIIIANNATERLEEALMKKADKATIKKIIDAGANSFNANDAWEVLFLNVNYPDKLAVVKMLLAAGVPITESTLPFAVQDSEEEVVKFLLANGARPDEHALMSAFYSKPKNKEIEELIIPYLKEKHYVEAAKVIDSLFYFMKSVPNSAITEAVQLAMVKHDEEGLLDIVSRGIVPSEKIINEADKKNPKIIEFIKNNPIYKEVVRKMFKS
jgi:hypothetical protein